MNKYIRITWCDAIIEESNGIYVGHDPDTSETFVITDLEYLPR